MISCCPKVSIHMLTYNQVDFVGEAVMSCLNQDYENIEIVISDDGSTDGTAEVLKGFKEKYSEKINLILNPVNQGIAKNSNVALSHCDGDLIALIGGDDVFYPTKISMQVREFQKNPSLAFCYHPCHVLMNGEIIDTIGNRRKDLVLNFFEMVAKYGAQIPGPVPMVAAWALPVGGYNEKIGTPCDWLFFIEVASKGEVCRLNMVLSQYRKHDNNVGKKIFSYSDDFLKTLELVEEKFKSNINILDACEKGRKRFLLGIVYNAILRGDKEAFDKYIGIYKKDAFLTGKLIELFCHNKYVIPVMWGLKKYIKKFC